MLQSYRLRAQEAKTEMENLEWAKTPEKQSMAYMERQYSSIQAWIGITEPASTGLNREQSLALKKLMCSGSSVCSSDKDLKRVCDS